jgi:signal transduction histidine kinase
VNRPDTAAGGRADGAPVASLRADRDELAMRLRAGATVTLIALLVFVAADLFLAHDAIAALLAVKAVQCTILLGGLLFMAYRDDERSLRRTGAIVLSLLYLTTIGSSVLRDEMFAAALMVLVTVLVTATFMPWGWRAQLATVVAAAVALAVTRFLSSQPFGREMIYRWVAIGLTLAASVWIAGEQERQRRERRRADRALAAASRVSSALARAGEEILRRESGPGIGDTICRLAADLLRCDRSGLVLYDAGENAFAVSAAYGQRAEDWEAIRRVRVSARALESLLAGMNEAGVVQRDTRTVEAPQWREQLERDRVALSLYVPLRHGEELLGLISAHRREGGGPFSPAEERIAIGVAHLASMALQNARLLDELREANRIKSEFVSTMSHELRTPVSVILGYTEMLAEPPAHSDPGTILTRIRRSGLELLDLVQETLDLGRLEAGHDPPRLEPVRVHEVFAELVDECAALRGHRGVAIRWAGPAAVDMTTDRRKLRIILKNLIGNALKFTAEGEVVLQCRVEDDVVRFVVRDTGIGIAPEHLPIIFDMFRQADSSDARRYPGTGLGLYIAQRLVHQLGGEIHVASELGRGSAFTFTLPRDGGAVHARSDAAT